VGLPTSIVAYPAVGGEAFVAKLVHSVGDEVEHQFAISGVVVDRIEQFSSFSNRGNYSPFFVHLWLIVCSQVLSRVSKEVRRSIETVEQDLIVYHSADSVIPEQLHE
jgi:hypothetical protein